MLAWSGSAARAFLRSCASSPLKQLLDEELVDEDNFMAWAGDYPRNEFSVDQSMITEETLDQLRVTAQPFITWLQEAEEEDDEDDEDEDDDNQLLHEWRNPPLKFLERNALPADANCYFTVLSF